MRNKKNRENKTPKEKQSHAQDSIYMVRQFSYVHKVAGISLLSKKITMCGYSVFLSQKQQQDKTLITKVDNISHPLKVSIPTNPYVNQTIKVEIDDDEYHHCTDSLYF